jgi:hypothetical protein
MLHPHRPTPAERARTLAAGLLVGALTAPGPREAVPVGCVTDDDGVTAILVREGPDRAALDAAGTDEQSELPAVLDVLDAPLGPDAPPRARLWLSGWLRAVPARRARGLALAYAARRPVGALLDVNDGCALYLLTPEEVRLTAGDGMTDVDLDAYLAARPDPLHESEHALLADLAARWPDELAALAAAAPRAPVLDDPGAVHAVGIDRYGLDLAYRRGHWFHRVRVPFDRPVRDEAGALAAVRALTRGRGHGADVRTS